MAVGLLVDGLEESFWSAHIRPLNETVGIGVVAVCLMLRVEHDRWGQRPDDLRALAVSSSHERTRERFLALYAMSSGTSATGVAQRIGRHPQSVMQWVHADNSSGPGAVAYRRTGGRPPFARRSRPRSAA
jgi:hypothetical protein